MKFNVLLAACLLGALGLAGCKFVKTEDVQNEAVKSGESGDQERIAVLLSKTYDGKLVPDLTSRAVDLGALKEALATGLDAAGEAHGVRAGGQGGSWNFAIKGTGTIVEENRASKAGTASIDIDGDGQSDATLQLGPVVKGTALRDVAPEIYDFSSFRDQIEFAKLGRALNKNAMDSLPIGDGEWTGKTISFVGAAAIRSAKDAPLIVPVVVEVPQ